MRLSTTSTAIFNQLVGALQQLEEEEYAQPLPVLSGNSIGKHVRHIVELYGCLVNGAQTGTINYDERKRDYLLETRLPYTLVFIKDLIEQTAKLEDKTVHLQVSYALQEESGTLLTTSCYRELAYNIEHAIHHMAILRIALVQHFNHIALEESFGVAPSTLKYQLKCAQ